jgi:excisionase family DNA binding protein
MQSIFESLAPLSVSFVRASELVGVSRNTLKRIAKTGQLRTIRIGRRRVVPYDALKELVSAESATQLSPEQARRT